MNQTMGNARNKAVAALDGLLAQELTDLGSRLLRLVDDNGVDLLAFMEEAIGYWREKLGVDRIFVCDMRDGTVIAGWNKGRNLARLADWDANYVPLEHDAIMQQALEGDELVCGPVAGEGADMAFSLPLDTGQVWLVVLDQTDTAREFSALDKAYIDLVRNLAVLKSRLVVPKPTDK